MVKDYRKKVGSKTGGIKLYSELKQDFINADIKIGRDKFYRLLRSNKLLIPKTKNYITTTNSNHMRTSLCTDALAMAIKNRKYPKLKLIHHSDRSFQYCKPKYTEYAEENGISMSMTEQFDPYENAVAERINRTLKYEYGLKQTIKNTEIAQEMTNEAVYIYNNLRTHFSLNLRKPEEVHLNPNIKYKSYRKNNVNLPELKI